MHDIIKFLSGIPERTPGAGIFSCYIVKSGSIYANSRAKGLTAGVELESPIDFAVPAPEMDAALGRMKEVTGLTVEGDYLLVKGGRLKTSIELCTDEPTLTPELPSEWLKVPAGFLDAIKIASQFIGDRHWSAGVRIWGNRVTALSNAAGVDIELPNLDVPKSVMLTAEAVGFLTAQGEPEGLAVEDNAILFRWSDGRWLHAQLLAVDMPEDTVKLIFDKAGKTAPIAIDDDTRAAYEDAAALSDGTVWVTPSGFSGRKGVIKATTEHEMDLPKDHCSAWGTKATDAMMKCATAWAPARWPELTCFVGKRLRGVIVGVNK